MIDSDAVKLAESEKTISIEMLAAVVSRHAKTLIASVESHKRHPSYSTRRGLLNEMNGVSGMFRLLLEMNGYQEINGSDVRVQVSNARRAVESLYENRK